MNARALDPIAEGTPIVVGAIDDNMAYPLLVWAWSLSQSTTLSPLFVIGHLEDSLSVHHQHMLGECLTALRVRHHFISLSHDARFISQGHISPTTFTKFMLADMVTLPHVWIDVDTVASHGWDDLFDVVRNLPEPLSLVVAKRGKGQSEARGGPSSLAFNAGVLGWPGSARKPWSERLSDLPLVETQEQALFNELYAHSVHTVSESFNTLTYRIDSLEGSPPPKILHYAGAHKPWHLPRRFRKLCVEYQCPWSLWFAAEEELLEALAQKNVTADLATPRRHALGTGGWSLRSDHRGRLLLTVLRILGPLGWVVVFVAQALRTPVPRGTHPLHYGARKTKGKKP